MPRNRPVLACSARQNAGMDEDFIRLMQEAMFEGQLDLEQVREIVVMRHGDHQMDKSDQFDVLPGELEQGKSVHSSPT